MPYLDLKTGIRMHYRDGGSGKPLLFIPGLSATVDTWNYQVLDLHESHRCICVDLRGHGDSDKPTSDYTYAEMCEDIADVIHQLELEDVTLVGWSMGAGVALKYATEFNQNNRVSRVAMAGAATPRFTPTADEPFGMDADTAQASLEGIRVALPETMSAFGGANFHREDMAATTQWFLSMWLKMPAYVGYKYFKTLLEEDLRENLNRLDLPLLLLHGRHDLVSDPRWADYMAARKPDAKLVWFENSGHALMVEEPDKFSRELAAFVAG